MDTTTNLMEGSINTDTGKAPDRRFINPKNKTDGEWIYNQIAQFKMVGNTKDLERREVEAMLRHAPPYSEDDLRALNMENMPNSTMGELPRRVAEAEGKWTDYVVSSNGLWQFTFPGLKGQAYDDIKEQVSELVNTLWMDESKHVLGLQLCFRQFSCYGIGPLVWIDCYDPSPIARVASDLKFPTGTRITLDNFSECSLHDTCTPQELYSIIRGDAGRARVKLHGWNAKEIMDVLKANSTGDNSNTIWGGSLESIELRERSGENIWKGYANKEITIIHVFIKEFAVNEKGNSISYVVLAQDGANWKIIRDKGHEYKGPEQFAALATDRVGSDMTIAGLRGMAVDLLEHCRSMDVMHNASLHAGFRSSIPLYASNGGNAAQSADQISVRPNGVLIPQGFEEVQTHVDFQAGGWAIDRLSNLADRYQGIYDINSPNKGGVQRTAKEAMFDAAKESDTRNNQILPIVRLFFEPIGREFFRRLLNFPRDTQGNVLKYRGWEIASKFWEGIDSIARETGMPISVLQKYRVTINPSNTPGGLDKKLMRVEASMKFYPTLQTQAQRNWLVNNGLISIFGHQASKPFLNQNEPQNPITLDIAIDSENADMVSGYQRRVFPEQDHLAHLGPLAAQGSGHVPFTMQKLAEIQQGVFEKFTTDPTEALAEQLRAGVTLKGHIDAHLAMLAQNPIIMEMPEVQGYFDFAAQLEQILLQTIKHFEQQAAAANPNGQVDPKTQALLQKTQAEIQAMQMKTQADIAMMQQKHMVKLGNQTQTSEARRDQKNAQFILDEILKQKKANADLAVKGMGHIIDLRAEQQKLDMQKDAQEDSDE